MLDLPSFCLALIWTLTVLAAYGTGTLHVRLVRWVRSKIMPSKPNGPRPVGRTVRRELQDAEMDLGNADRHLTPLADGDLRDAQLHAARAQVGIWKVLRTISNILGRGVDDCENGENGAHQ